MKRPGITIVVIAIMILVSMPFGFSQPKHQAGPGLGMADRDGASFGTPFFVFPMTFMVKMSDGATLATDLYIPPLITTAGCILVRTPYGKAEMKSTFVELSQYGFPMLVQDVRGRHASQGVFDFFWSTVWDGPDSMDWIASKGWSGHKVVTFGFSAMGIDQYFMAGADPPGLAGQFIGMATPRLHETIYQGGQFREQLMEAWVLNDLEDPKIWKEIVDQEVKSHHWDFVTLDGRWQDINVPAIHMGGWYDCFQKGILDGFMGYQYQGGPGAAGESKLIIGPWAHGGHRSVNQGELDYPKNAMDNFSFLLFTDMYLYAMGEPNSYQAWPAVMYYLMGDVDDAQAPGNEWVHADHWPPASTETPWYLHEDGILSKAEPSAHDPVTYTYDPDDPVPTLGGQNLSLENKGPFDQSEIESRDDVLVYTSDPLVDPYEAVGPIKVRLFVSSDRPDTDFTAKLTDVYPDGRSMLITDGIIRMRNRNGTDKWEFMEPGEIYEVEIDLWSTAYVWNTGHRIRVALSSSNYPRFLNNPNTEDGVYKNSTSHPAENTIHLDAAHPSCLLLPEM
jgi:predicted acyl esterase